jgi:hypothetical protein
MALISDVFVVLGLVVYCTALPAVILWLDRGWAQQASD